jgi:hypothetical protein
MIVAASVLSEVTDLVDSIGSLAALVVATATLVQVLSTKREVKTMNGSTMAEIIDDGETRRIRLIPEDERTTHEGEHLDHHPKVADDLPDD